MEIMASLLSEENKKEAVVVDDEPDPNCIGDWLYKDSLETQFLRKLENERKK